MAQALHRLGMFTARRKWIVLAVWIVLVAGLIAKLLHPGPNEPSGFVLTTLLGIAGALIAVAYVLSRGEWRRMVVHEWNLL